MARGRKGFVLPSEVKGLLVKQTDTVERKSDKTMVPFDWYGLPATASDTDVDKVFHAIPLDQRISTLNNKLKSGPRNAAANGVDEQTRMAEELISRVKKGDTEAKKLLAELFAS